MKLYKTEEHPDICTTLAQIAWCYGELGSYQEALKKYEHVLGK